MGTYNVRLGCQLAFDEERETDIVEAVKELNSTHKMGQFVSNILRLAFENPEVIEVRDGKVCKGAILKAMESCGLSYDRHKYMNQVNKELAHMKKKIDSIYEIALKTYSLGLMNKYLGIEDKADNNLRAAFVLERQLKDLQDKLGVSMNQVYVSNKLNRTHEIADGVLEYIIESYDGILTEMKDALESTGERAKANGMSRDETNATDGTSRDKTVSTTSTVTKENEVQTRTTTSAVEKQAEPIKSEIIKAEPVRVVESVETKSEQDEEVIDFGNADMSMLMNFFGE